MDFSTLTQIADTYVSKNLQKAMSDMIYNRQTKNSEKRVLVSLLIEHKSHPDKYAPVQIGGYIFSALQKQIDNKEKLSMVFSVLLYHGREKWNYRTLKGLFKDLPDQWVQFVPTFDYIYNNLGEISDEQVEAVKDNFLIASLLALKHNFQKTG